MFSIIEIFSAWCKQKIGLHTRASRPHTLFKQGEVWWCAIGMNIGSEMYGKGEQFCRPVFIYKKLTADTFFGLPTTTKKKGGSWYVEFNLHHKSRWILLNQARMFDARRLLTRIGEVTGEDNAQIRKRFIEFYRS